MAEAAEALGITAEAVRTRIKRGKLDSIKEPPDRTGTVYVLLGPDQTGPNTDPTPQGQDRTPDQTALVESLREQVAYLQGVVATRDRELAVRSEEIRRRDAALEREQQLAAFFAERLRELEPAGEGSGDQERSEEAPQEPTTAPGGAEQPQPPPGGPQTDAQGAHPWRSLWRRIVGG